MKQDIQAKQELTMFLAEYRKMRNAQLKERRAQGDSNICLREYNNIFYQAYLSEKRTDDMFHELEKRYSA